MFFNPFLGMVVPLTMIDGGTLQPHQSCEEAEEAQATTATPVYKCHWLKSDG